MEIQRECGYRDFSDASAKAELLAWLDARAWATAERPSVLFDLATARLIEGKVLLPGASVLARAVATARDRAAGVRVGMEQQSPMTCRSRFRAVATGTPHRY